MTRIAALLLGATLAGTAPLYAAGTQAGIDRMTESLQMERKLEVARSAIIKLWLSDKPHMLPYRQVIDEFMADYISWEALRGDFYREFAARFSAEELAEIERFYTTGPGSRMNPVIDEILILYITEAKGRIAADQARLQAMVRAEAERIEALRRDADSRGLPPARQ